MNRLAILIALVAACGGREATSSSASSGSATATAEAKPLGPEKPDKAKQPEPDLPDPETTKALADKACPRVVAPYYYRVEKDGKTSFMLGTRHMSVSFAKMPATVKDQLAKAKLVVFETAPGDESNEMKAPDKPLSALLGPHLWTRYTALVGAETAMLVENAPPAVAMISMMMLFEDSSAKLDGEIEEAAKDANIETGGLESSAFQDKLLGELLDLRMLKALIAGTPDRKTLLTEASEDIAEYCTGTDNTPGMDARTRKQLLAGGYTDAEITKLDEKLLDSRNVDWMPKLEKLFAKGDVFVVVGSDHLTGPRGVIAMLGARGFKTARVAP